MPKIRVVKRDIPTRDCTVGKEYDLLRVVPAGDRDIYGYMTRYPSYEFKDDVGDDVSAWGPDAGADGLVELVEE